MADKKTNAVVHDINTPPEGVTFQHYNDTTGVGVDTTGKAWQFTKDKGWQPAA